MVDSILYKDALTYIPYVEQKRFEVFAELSVFDRVINKASKLIPPLAKLLPKDVKIKDTKDGPIATKEKSAILLNGETEFLPITTDSTELCDNLSLGQEIIEHVHSCVLFSSNYSERATKFKWASEDYFQSHFPAVETMLNKLRKSALDLDPMSYLKCAAKAEKYGVGNCLEMALVGFKYALEKGVKQRVEYYEILNGDHGFLVIGRKEGSDPSDHKTWGPAAVVCDPWSGANYPASQIEQYLFDYKENMETPSKNFTSVAPFDATKQKLFCRLEYHNARLQLNKQRRAAS